MSKKLAEAENCPRPQTSPWHNIHDSFLIGQGSPGLQSLVNGIFAQSHPEAFMAMHDAFRSTKEEDLVAIDNRLNSTYQNERFHPGKLAPSKVAEFRELGAGSVQNALEFGYYRITNPTPYATPEKLKIRAGVMMLFQDYSYLTRTGGRRRGKHEENFKSHSLNYMFLRSPEDYADDSIMQAALATAGLFRALIEQGDVTAIHDIWNNSITGDQPKFKERPDLWSELTRVFDIHLTTYPDDAEKVSEAFKRELAASL